MTGEERNARRDMVRYEGSGGDGWVFEPEADPRLYDINEPRHAALIEWRLECFEKLGLDALLASTLALRKDVDREAVERLVKAGASGPQVRAILT